MELIYVCMHVSICTHSFPRSEVDALSVPVQAHTQNIPFFHQYMSSCYNINESLYSFFSQNKEAVSKGVMNIYYETDILYIHWTLSIISFGYTKQCFRNLCCHQYSKRSFLNNLFLFQSYVCIIKKSMTYRDMSTHDCKYVI